MRRVASRDDLALKINSLGVITGKVTYQNGEPKRGVNVVALSTQVVHGLRQTAAIPPAPRLSGPASGARWRSPVSGAFE